ncbi:MAG: GNAT family N-acetyltransferase [Lachnospiraceae bacterium]|nr:GNAT family N-acetyltransferase [Lachnospiraceae bacterium]
MIRNYLPSDFDALCTLWNTAGQAQGYAPLSPEQLHDLLTGHPNFNASYAFVLEEDGIKGFLCGCLVDGRPEPKGYLTCLILNESCLCESTVRQMTEILEKALQEAGCRRCSASYFNPIRLPWVIPGTPGHQHNNCPGVAEDLPLHRLLENCGYQVIVQECAMYLDLSRFEMPDWVEEKAAKMAEKHYTVDWYQEGKHQGLDEMVHSMNNSMWDAEIPVAARQINMLVGLYHDQVAGFTGPVYPEPTGRGYFAGIAVAAAHEKQGLGTLLFYRLCQAEKEAGSQYMSLFTGTDNHARRIYTRAGFEARRIFSLLQKEL